MCVYIYIVVCVRVCVRSAKNMYCEMVCSFRVKALGFPCVASFFFALGFPSRSRCILSWEKGQQLSRLQHGQRFAETAPVHTPRQTGCITEQPPSSPPCVGFPSTNLNV